MKSERLDVSGEGYLKTAIMFADIRDFTPLTHRLRTRDVPYSCKHPDPAKRGEVVTITDLLKSYLPEMSTCIRAEHGIVDKFMGDGIMAFFKEEDDALESAAVRSVRAALAMQQRFQDEILGRWEREWLGSFRARHNEALHPRVGIGIAYGEAEFGYFDRVLWSPVYTAVGEVVNLAGRLESIAGKYYEFETGKRQLAPIVVSGTVIDQVKGEFCCEEYEPILVKGIQFPQRIGGVLRPECRRESSSESASGT